MAANVGATRQNFVKSSQRNHLHIDDVFIHCTRMPIGIFVYYFKFVGNFVNGIRDKNNHDRLTQYVGMHVGIVKYYF